MSDPTANRHAQPLRGDVILVAYNPTAGKGDRQAKIDALVQQLRGASFTVELCSEPQRLQELATTLFAKGSLRGVIAAGGDGTVAMAVNALPHGIPLALFPLGTENLLARYVGHTCNSEFMATLFREGRSVALDAASANGRIFCLMAGCGFDAEVVRLTHAVRSSGFTRWSYLKPILMAIRAYSRAEMLVTVEHNGRSESLACRWAFISNIPRYAAGLRFNPQANAQDGLLDVCLFQHCTVLAGLRYFAGVWLGWHTRWSDVTLRQATAIRIESSAMLPYQLDGDPGGELPLEIRCLPERLNLIVTAAWAQKHGFLGRDSS